MLLLNVPFAFICKINGHFEIMLVFFCSWIVVAIVIVVIVVHLPDKVL